MSPQVIRRFSTRQIIEHASMMVLFTLLCVTGFPQLYFSSGVSQVIVDVFGGITPTRWVHRACGVSFTALGIWHLASVGYDVARGKAPLAMIATRKDFTDAVVTLRYYLGLSKEQARFDRYDYKQKFEYWGLVMGNFVMMFSGLALLFPVFVTQFLPGQVIPAAKAAHGSEALMACLVIVIWHIYNAHLNPDVFPFDTSIFTGKISRHRMEHEHPLELERLDREAQEAAREQDVAKDTTPATAPPPAPQPAPAETGGRD